MQTKHLLALLGILGLVLIPRTAAADEGAAKIWKGDVTAGFSQSNGNTDKAALNLSGSATRMFEEDELLFKGEMYYSSSEDRMDDQKWSILTKYTNNWQDNDRWFNSYQVLVDHDYFADIDYRITPAAGLGYWLIKESDIKWNVDGSLGYEMTRYRSATKDKNTLVGVGHSYFEKKVFDKATFSEDLTVIPSLQGDGYRLKSETGLTNPLTESMDLSLKYILDYDDNAPSGKKKTDTRIVAGVKYSF